MDATRYPCRQVPTSDYMQIDRTLRGTLRIRAHQRSGSDGMSTILLAEEDIPRLIADLQARQAEKATARRAELEAKRDAEMAKLAELQRQIGLQTLACGDAIRALETLPA